MTESSKGVFLSYASEDAEAARRIAAALRAAGVDVWIDQHELRGGDAWDRQIRTQIRECRLFLPIVSNYTEARTEGYFRREWKLAVERTHDLSERVAFLVPIVIDATDESEADVPEAFRAVQWSRLPDGEVPASFTARIVTLLGGASRTSPASTATAVPPSPTFSNKAKPAFGTHRWSVAFIGIVAVCAAYLAVDRLWFSKRVSARDANATLEHHASQADPVYAVSSRSVAVLPFVNMSSDKEQEYFSDGLSEELIDHLAHIADLKVIARTSSFAFKGKNEDVRTIAKKLGVANVLEGSVRKAGGSLRITAQLIRASDGVHLWSETYDRKVDDVFRMQDDIAAAVVRALSIALIDGATAARAAPTQSSEAHKFYLQGRAVYLRAQSKAEIDSAERFFREALTVDPAYADAWAGLALTLSARRNLGLATIEEVSSRLRHAAGQAVRYGPQVALAHSALAVVHTHLDWDWPATLAEYRQAYLLSPGYGPHARDVADWIWALGGDAEESRKLYLKAIDLDPANSYSHLTMAYWLYANGQLPAAEVELGKVRDLDPSQDIHGLVSLVLLAGGKPQQALIESKLQSSEVDRLAAAALIFPALGKSAEADAALLELTRRFAATNACDIARAHANRGEPDKAFEWLDRAFAKRDICLIYPAINRDPLYEKLRADPRYLAFLGKMHLPN